MKNISIVIIGILQKDDKFLLTYRDEHDQKNSWANHHWQLPGGSIEFGETPEQTVVREMKEELGLDVTNPYLISKIVTKISKDWQGLLICYKCDYNSSQTIVLNNEASKYEWFTYEEAKLLKTLPGLLEILSHVI